MRKLVAWFSDEDIDAADNIEAILQDCDIEYVLDEERP